MAPAAAAAKAVAATSKSDAVNTAVCEICGSGHGGKCGKGRFCGLVCRNRSNNNDNNNSNNSNNSSNNNSSNSNSSKIIYLLIQTNHKNIKDGGG